MEIKTSIFIVILFVTYISNIFALPFSHCTDFNAKNFFREKSDLIVLVEIKSKEEITNNKNIKDLSYTNKYTKQYIATCKILETFKGQYNKRNINIFFYRDYHGLSFNQFPIPFSLNKKIYYILFLKKDTDGEYIPVTGHKAGEGSCIMVLKKISNIPDRIKEIKERVEKKKLRKEKNKEK